ncbi:Lsr2 family protein [Streptomyces sp. NPDC051555]|uniref:Lsr2 family protein n=1 Tax=Streptomyces sp. NPDC051555 TaxID=3365657 RepID=UPI0037B5E315
MAKKTVIVRIDDLTGEESDEVAAHTFCLDGITYAIDLTPESYDEFLDVLGRYLGAAQKLGTLQAPTILTARRRLETAEAVIRRWASEQGYPIAGRGHEVRASFLAAGPTVQHHAPAR